MAQVKERGGGGEEREETLADKPLDFENRPLGLSVPDGSRTDIWCCHQLFLPSLPPPPAFIFWFLFNFSRDQTETPLPRSLLAPKPNGNACYAGYLWPSAQHEL